MDINVTLLVEILTFAILVWMTMKYIWPPILHAIEERQKKIADGLAAAERGELNLKLARKNVKEQLKKTKAESTNIIDQANKQAAKIIEAARDNAEKESKKILALAKEEIATEMETTKRQLYEQTVNLAIKISSKILSEKIDAKAHKELIDKIIEET